MAETTVRIAVSQGNQDLMKTLSIETRTKVLHHAAHEKAWKTSSDSNESEKAGLQDKIIGIAKLSENDRQLLKILTPSEKGAALVAEARRRIELDRMLKNAFDEVKAPFSWSVYRAADGPYSRFRELLEKHTAVLEWKEGTLVVSSTNGWGDEYTTVVDAIERDPPLSEIE